MILKKIKKYTEYFMTKIIQFVREKKFFYEGVRLKYLYSSQKDSDALIVVFSSCTRAGIKARYNYVRTLNNVKANCLFILDDFGEDHRGAYYLGKNCGNEIEKAVEKLIVYIKEISGAEQLIFCGSSKGAWAALNIMTSFSDSVAIVGAPQYKLANYLLSPALATCKRYVMSDTTETKIKFLNDYLKNKLEKAKGNHNIVYLHYSNREHTYEDHVKYLIEDLNNYGYKVIMECCGYTEHWDVSMYYPDFLLRSLGQCLYEQ